MYSGCCWHLDTLGLFQLLSGHSSYSSSRLEVAMLRPCLFNDAKAQRLRPMVCMHRWWRPRVWATWSEPQVFCTQKRDLNEWVDAVWTCSPYFCSKYYFDFVDLYELLVGQWMKQLASYELGLVRSPKKARWRLWSSQHLSLDLGFATKCCLESAWNWNNPNSDHRWFCHFS